jgi:putative tryptophan/tyrosine transport system substrate-binding protein
MRRRAFMAGLGGAAVWPLVARAQQIKVYRVGALLLGNADAEAFRTTMREELLKSGYSEGQDIAFNFRSAEGKLDLLPGIAAELVQLNVDVIVAVFTPCALAAQRVTNQIPIVAVAADLIGSGLVASLARPGGNITGVSLMGSESHGKCVELFRDMIPSLHRVAALSNTADPSWREILGQVQLAGKLTGIEIAPTAMVHGLDEIDAAFAAMTDEKAGAVVIQGSLSRRDVAELALKHGLPAATVPRSFAEVGGLMSYGFNAADAFRRAASFVVRLRQGGRPSDMPVEQPTKFDLVINLKTAKALGLKIPPTLLARADEVIE